MTFFFALRYKRILKNIYVTPEGDAEFFSINEDFSSFFRFQKDLDTPISGSLIERIISAKKSRQYFGEVSGIE